MEHEMGANCYLYVKLIFNINKFVEVSSIVIDLIISYKITCHPGNRYLLYIRLKVLPVRYYLLIYLGYND